jgi:hypothetical protein
MNWLWLICIRIVVISCLTRVTAWSHKIPTQLADLSGFIYFRPVIVAERSKACTIFARSEAGIVGSTPTEVMDVWYVSVFILCVCVVLCLDRGLAMDWSLVQEVLAPVNDQNENKKETTSTP